MRKLPLVLLSLIPAGMAGGCNYRTIVASRDFSGDAPGIVHIKINGAAGRTKPVPVISTIH